MKTNFVNQCKSTLGKKIDDFIRNGKYSGKKARINFANDVNNLLGLNNFDEQANYKKVSRWITSETFPDFITIMAIAKVMGVTIDQLFDNNMPSFTKINDLTASEISTLKSLILNVNEKALSRVYIPYSFHGKRLDPILLNRTDIINYYKEKATKYFSLHKLKDYVTWLKNNGTLLNEEYFDRFCSVEFIENKSENEIPTIYYTNTDDYYKEISNIWKKHKTDNFYNAVFFSELIFDSYDESILDENGEKALYYKTKAFAEKTYEINFSSLVEKGIITPTSPTHDIFNWDDDTTTENDFNLDKNISVFTDCDNEYILTTISFSFNINLNEIEMKEILLMKN